MQRGLASLSTHVSTRGYVRETRARPFCPVPPLVVPPRQATRISCGYDAAFQEFLQPLLPSMLTCRFFNRIDFRSSQYMLSWTRSPKHNDEPWARCVSCALDFSSSTLHHIEARDISSSKPCRPVLLSICCPSPLLLFQSPFGRSCILPAPILTFDGTYPHFILLYSASSKTAVNILRLYCSGFFLFSPTSSRCF